MRFDRLLASVNTHAQEQPTVYMALCMVQALFVDVENAADLELSQCPAGSEDLAVKLTWLARTVLEVYRDQKDGFQHKRPRLDQAMAELERAQKQMETLYGGLSQLTERKARLECQVQELSQAESSLRSQVEALEQTLLRRSRMVQALNGELEQIKARTDGLQKEKEELTQACAQAKQEASVLEAWLHTYPAQELEPAQAALESLQEDAARQRERKEALDAQCAQARKNLGQLVLDSGLRQEELEAIRGKLPGMRTVLYQRTQERDRLNGELTKALESMEALQQEVQRLETQDLPRMQHLHEQEQAHRDALTQTMADAETQRCTLARKSAELEAALPGLEEELNRQRNVYNRLTASFAAHSSELEQLRRQIQELRNNDSAEKLELYRSQLEDTRQTLEDLQEQNRRLAQEIQALEAKRVQQEQEYEQRKALKARQDAADRDLQELLRQLKFTEDPQYLSQLRDMEEQAALLASIRNSLCTTMDGIRRVLGAECVEWDSSLEEQAAQQLHSLRLYLEQLRCALLSCAQSLKLEVRG